MFLKNTYVDNMDVSPPISSALEVALVTFAKNLETGLVFMAWKVVREQRSHGTITGSWLHRVHAAWDSQ